jgi:hypothetical protein
MSEEKKNLELYNRVREVPNEAQKPIQAGRLKGKTDINPMWRIQTLTKEFGPAGVGWYTEVEKQWTETVGSERAVYLEVHLFTKTANGWSAPIVGFGGAMVAAQEKNGIFVDDDALKKAYTDALSQCCRSLGIGANVYWEADVSKYQQEKAIEESRDAAIEYINGCSTQEMLNAAWEHYKQWFGNDKEFKLAFTKRQREVSAK